MWVKKYSDVNGVDKLVALYKNYIGLEMMKMNKYKNYPAFTIPMIILMNFLDNSCYKYENISLD